MYYVYVLKGDKMHYIGYTDNLEKRIERHKNWETITTRKNV